MTFSDINSIVIVGAGQAGGWAAKTLRDSKYDGSVRLIGDESHPPYERPPLSKGVLADATDPTSAYLWTKEKLADLRIEFESNTTVTAINRETRSVLLSDERRLPYGRLLIATGARPRRLTCPGAELPGTFYVRTIEDSLALRAAVAKARRILVVGGGWIGLEVAASLRRMGHEVVLVEAGAQLCGRVLPPSLARHLQALHLQNGVEIRLNSAVRSIEGSGRASQVALADGSILDVDAVVVGIGAQPNVELAAQSGLLVDNGIVVDERAQTSDTDIFAAGDVARQRCGSATDPVRLESWKNAQDQGIVAGKAMLGLDPGVRDLPWFWSDQYDANFQMFGLPPTSCDVYEKDVPGSRLVIQYFVREGALIAAAGINCSRDLREAKRAILAKSPFKTEGLRPVARNEGAI